MNFTADISSRQRRRTMRVVGGAAHATRQSGTQIAVTDRRPPAAPTDWAGPGLRWHQRTVDVFDQLHRVTVPISGPFPLQTVTRPLAAALDERWVGTDSLGAGVRVTSVSAEVQVRGADRSLVLLVTTAGLADGDAVAGPQMIRDLRRALRSLIAASNTPLTVAA